MCSTISAFVMSSSAAALAELAAESLGKLLHDPLHGASHLRIRERTIGALELEPEGHADLPVGYPAPLVAVEDRDRLEARASRLPDPLDDVAGGDAPVEADGQMGPDRRGGGGR